MTPAARVAAVFEMAELIDNDRRPADIVAGIYLQARRYIGSSDRRAISDRLWGLLRRRTRLDWTIEGERQRPDWRTRLLADLVVTDKLTFPELLLLFPGGERGLARLDNGEQVFVQQLRGAPLNDPKMPPWVANEYPEWLDERLRTQFGNRVGVEMAALREPAPVDLRVNTLKGSLDEARAALVAAELDARPTPWSPIGLRLPARTPLTAQALFKGGQIEVQDEGSQIAALMVDARPGQFVVDLCAGAGGKTLALAAAMQNKGRLFALDIDARRSERAAERLRRAGVANTTRRVLDGNNDKWLKRQAGLADRVLVDAPCSGTGTWRRNPDAKWRLTEPTLAELALVQGQVLDNGAKLVKPGGRLIYVTCSLLEEENGGRVAEFLARAPQFKPLPVWPIWQKITDHDPLDDDLYLRLTPARHNTDGFFVAVMERQA